MGLLLVHTQHHAASAEQNGAYASVEEAPGAASAGAELEKPVQYSCVARLRTSEDMPSVERWLAEGVPVNSKQVVRHSCISNDSFHLFMQLSHRESGQVMCYGHNDHFVVRRCC